MVRILIGIICTHFLWNYQTNKVDYQCSDMGHKLMFERIDTNSKDNLLSLDDDLYSSEDGMIGYNVPDTFSFTSYKCDSKNVDILIGIMMFALLTSLSILIAFGIVIEPKKVIINCQI